MMRYFTASEERIEIERLARMIFKAIYGDMFDADTLVAYGAPVMFMDGHITDMSRAAPAWCRYLGAAKAVFDDTRRQEEQSSPVRDLSI